MKHILMALLLTAMGASVNCAAAPPPANSNTLVWCGLDYSKVKMIGSRDFRQPDQIFPEMLMAWNGLFVEEMLPKLEKMAKSVRTDLRAVQERNQKASASQIDRIDGSRDEMVKPTHITDEDIAETVKSYKLENDSGLGCVFIMDRLVKAQATGCMHVVFFDIPSRKVLRSQRVCAEAGGGGFRNYWFRPVKEAVEQLPKMYKQLRAGK